MSDCCSSCSSIKKTDKHNCPVNSNEYKKVSIKTIKHHIKEPWLWQPDTENYYFCNDPDCEVVYFGDDDSTIIKDALRTLVGIKEKSDQATICYCFGVSLMDAENDKTIKDFVTEQTRNKICDCEIRNPSGKCCLKDFPKS